MKWVITGGCGFIGSNVVTKLVAAGHEPVVLDNLSRPRVAENFEMMRNRLGLEIHVGDVRDRDLVQRLMAENSDADVVLHLAGQVSFLRSLTDPRLDFETNALGTLNVLEAVKRSAPAAVVIYSSTNKVYGDLADLTYSESVSRYFLPTFPNGLPESLPLSLQGGYSCSKGAADQMVLDWARFHALRTVSFRQSSVFGGRQFSTEDQGWAAFFAERFVSNKAFAISGNGKQVRDLLHVSDLYEAYMSAALNPQQVSGRAFNIGGGPGNSLSLLELFEKLAEQTGNMPRYVTGPNRPADQKVFIADSSALAGAVQWRPRIDLERGILEMLQWARRMSS